MIFIHISPIIELLNDYNAFDKILILHNLLLLLFTFNIFLNHNSALILQVIRFTLLLNVLTSFSLNHLHFLQFHQIISFIQHLEVNFLGQIHAQTPLYYDGLLLLLQFLPEIFGKKHSYITLNVNDN